VLDDKRTRRRTSQGEPEALNLAQDDLPYRPVGIPGRAEHPPPRDLSGADMVSQEKGKAVRSIHHVGDELWRVDEAE